ncbi:MAG: Calx-beta domain-containing protein, partial [Kiritimatiellia bacterium]
SPTPSASPTASPTVQPTPLVGFVNATLSGSEGKIAVFEVRLTSAYAEPVTVSYQTSDGTAQADLDYQPLNGELTFLCGRATLESDRY